MLSRARIIRRRNSSTTNGYFLSSPTLKAFKFLLLSRQDLILAAPHAGSTRMIERTCLELGDELGAKIHSIDYLSLIGHKEITGNISNYRLERDEKLTKAFSPGAYHIDDGTFDDDYEDDFDDDEIEDEEQSASAFNFKYPTKPFKKALPKITVNLSLSPEPESTSESLERTFKLSSLSFGTQSSTEEIQKSTGTIYDIVVSDDQINSYLTTLNQSVHDLNSLGEGKTFIILVKDTTDMLEAPGNSGKRFFFGLMDVVEQLRKNGVNACLIAASSPSLTDPKNLDKDLDFYSQIMDGSLPNMAKKGSDGVSIASDGTLFDTSLDNLTERFQKIQLLPPSPNFTALHTVKDDLSGRSRRHLNKFSSYLAKLDQDLKGRLAEMNCGLLEYLARLKNIKIDSPPCNLLVSKEVNGQKFLPKPFLSSIFSRNLWTVEEGNRILSIACGTRIHELKLNVLPENLSLNDLTDALKVVYETDIRRCPPVGFEEKITPAKVDPEEGDGENEGGMSKTSKSEDAFEKIKVHAAGSEISQFDHEKITADFKRRGVKLNTHEKRILSTVINPANIKTEFADLILPAHTKLVLQTLVTLPLLRPKYFASGILSKSSINGVLMFGPPGTGKTMLAKAVAKGSGAWFMNVALSDIFEKYVGEGEKNVRAIFSLARKLSGPCVIFLDEVDAVFSTRRNDSSGSSKREIMNEFMSEWDGLMSNNHGIVVLGATNRPFDLDDAILRRMPRRILIDLPDEKARAKILKTHLKGENLDETVDIQKLAKITANYSGSDLKNVCVSAALARIKENILRENSNDGDELDSSSISQKIAGIDDWGSFLSHNAVNDDSYTPLKPLNQKHFDIGLEECPPSLSEEMETLVELRKWDSLYGDGASKRRQKPSGIGFELIQP